MFGEVRASSGVGSVFGFSGEQFDSETGFTFLRTRYLDPRLGRFLSMDGVQPNAPGTQGYNPYAYVANNPTTWVDPSGHIVIAAAGLILYSGSVITLGLIVIAVSVVLVCALTPACHDVWQEYEQFRQEYGSRAREGMIEWTRERLHDVAKKFPHVWRSTDTPDIEYPGNDATQAPGEEWEWRGSGPPESGRGNWHNPTTDESLHPDLQHGPPKGPHWDYEDPNGNKWEIYPDGKVVPKR